MPEKEEVVVTKKKKKDREEEEQEKWKRKAADVCGEVEGSGNGEGKSKKRRTKKKRESSTLKSGAPGGEVDVVVDSSASATASSPAPAPSAARRRKKKKKKKRRKVGGAVHGSSSPAAAAVASVGTPISTSASTFTSSYPYEVNPDDHCETSPDAYLHISPFLEELARQEGKTKEELRIYDPYYCEGSVKQNLAKLGYTNVYNEKEDFYAISSTKQNPPHDCIVTNPPFSGDHMEKILKFCTQENGNRPWFLLMPNFVYLKDYFTRAVAPPRTCFFVVPPMRYRFHSPASARLGVKAGERRTSPFPSFWYCWFPRSRDFINAFRKAQSALAESGRTSVATSPAEIPLRFMDSNDPVRKKARDREKRSKKRKKK